MYHSTATPVLESKIAPHSTELGQPQSAGELGGVALSGTVVIERGRVESDGAQRLGGLALVGGLLKRFWSHEEPADRGFSESTAVDAAECIERRGFVRIAPRFADQAQDTTRTNRFNYRHPYRGNGSMTEYEGLQELSDFLRRDPKPLHTSMLESLTFIGEKEYAEASEGLAAYWKRHLDSGKDAQLCVLALISDIESMVKSDQYLLERILANLGILRRKVKSDQYLLERILEHFTDEELKRYKGQIVFDPRMLTSDPTRVKVILLDDWVISGSQMRTAGYCAMKSLEGAARRYLDSLEINLITASRRRLREQNFTVGNFKLPVKAYYMAHDANGGPVVYTENNAYVSGTHSSTDHEFSNKLGGRASSPALVYVKRTYHKSSRPKYRRVLKALSADESQR